MDLPLPRKLCLVQRESPPRTLTPLNSVTERFGQHSPGCLANQKFSTFSSLSTLSSVTTAPRCFSHPSAWRISEVSGNRLTEALSGHLINPFFASRQSLQRILLQSNFSSGLQGLEEMRPCAAQGHGLLDTESPSPSGHIWDLLTHHPERCPHSWHTTWSIWTGDTRLWCWAGIGHSTVPFLKQSLSEKCWGRLTSRGLEMVFMGKRQLLLTWFC